MPDSFYYGVRRTYISTGSLGYDRKLRNEKENERFHKEIRALAKNEEPIRKLITIVISEFYNKLDAQGKEVVLNQFGYDAGRLTGRVGTQILTSQVISAAII